MKILRNFTECLKDTLDIASIIGSYIDLRNGKGLCPFHDDHNPSFSINSLKQYAHCFGCGWTGDVIAFVMKFDNLSFFEAVRNLSSLVGMHLPEFEEGKWERTESRRRILQAACLFYHRCLNNISLEYLHQRAVNEVSVESFMLGFANGDLHRHLIDELKFDPNDCIEIGLVRRIGDNYCDYFSDRIVIPIIYHGEIVHFTSRSIGEAQPKYLHLPGEIPYLFNEDACSNDMAVIVEGPFDAIALQQIGIGATALLGTRKVPERFANKLKKNEKVYVCLDSDSAGKKAAQTIAQMFPTNSFVVSLPDGVDVDEFIQTSGAEEFRRLLDSSPDAINFCLHQIPQNAEKIKLSSFLTPLFEMAVRVDRSAGEAIVKRIKEYFNLSWDETKAIRTEISAKRRSNAQDHKQRNQRTEEKKYSAHFDGLVDVVNADGNTAFLTVGGSGLHVEVSHSMDREIVFPPPLPKIMFNIPDVESVKTHYAEYQNGDAADVNRRLFLDLVEYHRSISQLPSDNYYLLLAAWTMHTYLFEHFYYSPIIAFCGVAERGKSRTGKGMIYVAFRGICQESLREPFVIRAATDMQASLFFDCMDFWETIEKRGTRDIILGRFERGEKVSRVHWPDRGAFCDMAQYTLFGPTIIASNDMIDEVLMTRCINISMPTTDKIFENNVTPEIGQSLRDRLTAFRAYYLKNQLPEFVKTSALRLGDLMQPLMQIVSLVCPEALDRMQDVTQKLAEERAEAKSETLDADIVRAVIKLKDSVKNGLLPQQEITDDVNKFRNSRYEFSSRRIGKQLKLMGFDITRNSSNSAAIIYNPIQIRRIASSTGIDLLEDFNFPTEPGNEQ